MSEAPTPSPAAELPPRPEPALRPLPKMQRQPLQPSDTSREGQDAWVTTYMDLITLLLTLFVVLLAYADRGEKEYQAVTSGMAQALVTPTLSPPPTVEPSRLQQMAQQLQQYIELTGMGDEVSLALQGEALQIALSEKILFASGEAQFSHGAGEILEPIIALLRGGGDTVTVEGHTDNVPIANLCYPSNWELSAARATYVVRYLIDKGIPSTRLRAIGYADTRPIADNDSEAGRRRNRRVTLLITPAPSTG